MQKFSSTFSEFFTHVIMKIKGYGNISVERYAIIAIVFLEFAYAMTVNDLDDDFKVDLIADEVKEKPTKRMK